MVHSSAILNDIMELQTFKDLLVFTLSCLNCCASALQVHVVRQCVLVFQSIQMGSIGSLTCLYIPSSTHTYIGSKGQGDTFVYTTKLRARQTSGASYTVHRVNIYNEWFLYFYDRWRHDSDEETPTFKRICQFADKLSNQNYIHELH